jgi:hypothetical protein
MSLRSAHFYTMNWYVQWISPSINISYIFKTALSFSLDFAWESLIGRVFISNVFAGNTKMCPAQYVDRNLRVQRDCSKEQYMEKRRKSGLKYR